MRQALLLRILRARADVISDGVGIKYWSARGYFCVLGRAYESHDDELEVGFSRESSTLTRSNEGSTMGVEDVGR